MADEIESIKTSIRRSIADAPRYVDSATSRVSELSKSFHQTLVTLGSGGILLTVSLVDKRLIDKTEIFWPSLAFTMILLVVLLAFMASRVAFSRESRAVELEAFRYERIEFALARADFDRATELLNEIEIKREEELRTQSRVFRRISLCLEVTAVLALVLGVWALLTAVR